jgi:hypothetical protein
VFEDYNFDLLRFSLYVVVLILVVMFVFFEGYRVYLNLVINDCRVETVYCLSPLDSLLP